MSEQTIRIPLPVPKPRRSINTALRFRALERDRFACGYCGRHAPRVELEVDHIKPVVAGGTNDIANLITACRDCNGGKSGREMEAAIALYKSRESNKQGDWWTEVGRVLAHNIGKTPGYSLKGVEDMLWRLQVYNADRRLVTHLVNQCRSWDDFRNAMTDVADDASEAASRKFWIRGGHFKDCGRKVREEIEASQAKIFAKHSGAQ